MKRLRPVLGAAVCMLALAQAPNAAAQGRTLTPDALRSEALLALETGQPAVAAQYARALLTRDATDFGALLVLARAARNLGQSDTAKAAAAAAWDVAESPDERFAAAMVRAQVLASADQRTQAQLWLRRAAEIAPSDRLRRVAVRDFRYVRARNPLSTQLSFSIAPNSNINNGSRQDEGTYDLPIFGVVDASLDGAAQALSGLEISGGAALRYRLSYSESQQTDLTLGVSHTTYLLSDAAKSEAPGVKGRDFAFTSLSGGLSWRGFLLARTRPFQVSGTLGRTWYGGEPYLEYGAVNLRQSLVLAGGQRIDADLGRRWQNTLTTRTSDADILDVGLSWRGRIAARHHLHLGVTWRDSRSDSANLDYARRGLFADLTLGKPVFGAQVELGFDIGLKHHPEGPVAGEDRADREAKIGVTAVLGEYEYYGFVPTVSVTAQRVESDYGQYDADTFALSIGLRSAF